LDQLQQIIATKIWLIPLLDQLQQVIATKIWLIPLLDQLQQIIATKFWLIALVDVRQHLQNWGKKEKRKSCLQSICKSFCTYINLIMH
jgi:hypothetical protein